MKHYIALFFIVFSNIILCAQSNLEYKLNKGDTFVIKQSAEQIITQELDGAAHVLTNVLDGILEFTVVEEQNNNYKINLKFKDLNLLMTSSIQGEIMNINAKEVNEEDIQSKMFNSLLEQPVTLLLSKKGAIIEVTGGDSLVSKMANSSGLEDEFSKNLIKKSLEKEFGSKALSNSYEQMTFFYPEKTVSVGDTWQNEYAGKLKTKNTWTLTALENSMTTISGTASMIMEVNDPATTMKMQGTQNTKITTNNENGFIKVMNVTSEAKGVSILPQLGEQEIPTTITSTITYKLIE